ncbi:MAG: hypothetical protein JW913_01740, partial [Chitinispirillaceae bacterium]|nr:hypothetical protein [Chitinispirillaceae bacterium]
MIKKGFLYLKSSFLQGAVLTAIVGGAFLVPVTNAAISETMPGSIPSEILADWKDQGTDANKIKASLPAE